MFVLMVAESEVARESPLWRPQEASPNCSLYFSLYPASEIAIEANRLARELRGRHGLVGRPVPPERLHISLNGLGAFPAPCVRTVERALQAVREVNMRPFRIALDRAESWGRGSGKRPLVLTGDEGVEGVSILHGRIHAALADTGLVGRRERPIVPHMTLLRDPQAIPSRCIRPLVWTAGAFALVYSLKDEGRHQVLGRIPLSG